MTPLAGATAAIELGNQLLTLYMERRAGKPRAEMSAEEEAEQLAAIRSEISTAKGKAAFLALAEEVRLAQRIGEEQDEFEPADDVDGEPI